MEPELFPRLEVPRLCEPPAECRRLDPDELFLLPLSLAMLRSPVRRLPDDFELELLRD